MMTTNHSLQKQEMNVLMGALACGIIHYLLFYNKEWGLSYPLFTLCFYLYFYWSVNERGERKLQSWLLLIPIGLLSLTYAAFTNTLFIVLNALAIPCLILIHTTWMMRRPNKPWFDWGIVVAVLDQIFVHSFRYIPMPVRSLARAVSFRRKWKGSQQLGKVLAGVAISLPLLLLVGALLASADTMFERMLSQFPAWFKDVQMGSLVFQIGWIVVMTVALFAYIWGLLYPKPPMITSVPSSQAAGTGEEGNTGYPVLYSQPFRVDATIMGTILIMLNGVYVLFAIVQFSYFFAGGSATLPDGVTYAEYARRGFAELVVVTMINFSLLMFTLHVVDRSKRSMDRFLRVLLAMLVGCTGVMLCSAFFRLSMYELAYGYTVTRVLVHAFMLFLVVLFAIALYKLWNDRFRLLQPYTIAAIAAYVLLNYIQVDAIVASNNLQRYETTGKIDVEYLGSLSLEAVPYLLVVQHKYPELAQTTEVLQSMKEQWNPEKPASWTEWNWSKRRAIELLNLSK